MGVRERKKSYDRDIGIATHIHSSLMRRYDSITIEAIRIQEDRGSRTSTRVLARDLNAGAS